MRKTSDSIEKQGIVFIVDDEKSVRNSLRRFFDTYGYTTETFSSADEFLARMQFDGVGCLVLDLQMPDMTGIELQRRLEETRDRLPIVFLTAKGDIPTTVEAMKLGAEDFLPKMAEKEQLLDAVQRALQRSREFVTANEQIQAKRRIADSLTERELQVCKYVISGLLNKQIAAELGIAERTVKAHRAQVMKKFCVDSVAELVRICQQACINPIAE